MINKNELCGEDEPIDLKEICPFMSRFETGCGSYTGFVKCVKERCMCYNKTKKICGVKK